VIAALGIIWVLDGLEVTMVGNVAAVLTGPKSGPSLSEGQVGLVGRIYIAGACSGTLFLSYLTDRYGRKGFGSRRAQRRKREPMREGHRLGGSVDHAMGA
jgi:MFS family permease